MGLEIPKNAKTWEMRNSIIWFDDNGILYSRPKFGQAVEQTRDEVDEEIKKFLEITGGHKVCLIIEPDPSAKPPKKEDREYIAGKLASVTKAMALINPSSFSRMVANLFFAFQPPTYPVKMFNDVDEARAWLKNYL